MRFTIAIPEPCLVVLVGPAGSGKTTFAGRHFAPQERLASDDFRARLGRDAADQAANHRVFSALHAALERRLAAARTTVVDATNIEPAARQAVIRRARAAGLPAVAIVFDLPLADCLAGNLEREDRHVPGAVVERHWERLRAADDAALVAEGFIGVHRLTSRAVVDSVTLRRGLEGWPTLSPAAPPGP